VARFTAAGGVDTTFGNGGKVTTSILGNLDVATAMLAQKDGKIVVAGQTYHTTAGLYEYALAEYNPDGSLAPSSRRHH
jgi:hypothetical protein